MPNESFVIFNSVPRPVFVALHVKNTKGLDGDKYEPEFVKCVLYTV